MCLPLVAETLLYCRPPLALCSGHARSRRRQNPLYESHGSDSPTPAKSKGRQCPCAVTVVIALLAVAAFIMALLVITGTTTSRVYLVSRNHEKDLAKALARIKVMENDYAARLSKYDQSENIMAKLSEWTDSLSSTGEGTADLVGVLLSNISQQQDILTQLRSQLESLSVKFVRQNDSLRALQLQFHDIDTQLEAMRNLPSGVDKLQKDVVKQTQKLAIVERKFQRLADNVTSQVSMVSKMQGPPGVGNLTRCRHNKYSRGSAAAAVSDTTTAWIPQSQQEANDLVVMGVECTTDGGTGSYLETKEATGWNGLQYRCVCFGNGGRQTGNRTPAAAMRAPNPNH
ncbi:hypothetical protein LSAT2_018025 [Lamellibrachia satsuma]|nr:hypothetical protein LSAT2_018025 [Lamellibrachia satsuma]